MSTTARVLLTSGGVGQVTQVVPIDNTPPPGNLVVQHNAGTTIFTATTALNFNAPVVNVPGVTFSGSGVAFSQGVAALGESSFGTIATNAVTTDVANVNTINPAVVTGDVTVTSNLNVEGSLRVKGSVDTILSRNLEVRDKVVTLGVADADDNAIVDLDDSTRDGAGIVVAGAPANMPSNKDPANYEHSLTWNRRDGDFLPGGEPLAPHRKSLWRLKGGGFSMVAPDAAERQAEFYFAPLHTASRATLGLYYGLDDGRTRLVHTFDTPAFPQAAPTWRTSQNLVAAVNENRSRSFVAYRASSYTLQSGTLPPGTTLSTAGLLTGAATLVGDYTFTVRASSADAHADRSFVYRVLTPAPYYTGVQAPRWTTRQVSIRPVPEGCGLAVQFDAWDPYQAATYNDAMEYSVLSGSVPEGCGMSESGLLSTTGRLKRGSYTFTARAYSRASHLWTDKTYTITVVAPPTPSATVSGLLTSVTSGSIGLNVTDAIAVVVTVDFYAYVSVHQAGTADTYWAVATVSASGDLLTLNLSGLEAMTYRPTNQGLAVEALPSPVTPVAAFVGLPVTLNFYPFRNVGQLRIPRDLGDMNAFDPVTATTVLNGSSYVAEVSFTAAQGSPGACCNGGYVRSAPNAAHWNPRFVHNDYTGPTSTVYFMPGTAGIQTMYGEYFELRLPLSLKAQRYTFDPTVSDVPSSWSLLGLTASGLWQLLDTRDSVEQPLNETDYGLHVSDVAEDRVYSFANTVAYNSYRLVVRSTTGLVGNTFHLSGFSVVINPAA